jgi:modulator of FtsH protease
MSGWENFFVAEVGASAALAGLVFVGVSINLDKIISIPGLPGRAGEALAVLLAVLLTSSLLLVPGQPLTLIGLEVLIVGLVAWIATITIIVRSLPATKNLNRRYIVIRTTFSQAATLPFVFSGIATLVWGAVGLYWLVPATIFSFIAAIEDAWVLLIEINR